jgi:hypothetical protein
MDMETRQTPKGSSFQWGPIVGLVGAVAALGVIGYAVARNNARPEPEPVVTVAPEPAPVYVDIRSLAAAMPKRDDEPTTAPSTQPADEIPGEVAKGTGVIAVKKGGKAKVAKVAAVADKPLDPDYAARRPNYYDTPTGGGYRGGGAPRVYGEETPEERYWRLRRENEERNRPQAGPTIREAETGTRRNIGGLR